MRGALRHLIARQAGGGASCARSEACLGTLSRWWMNRAYGDTMIETAGTGRMVHLEQRLANDGHLAALSRKARQEMSEPARG